MEGKNLLSAGPNGFHNREHLINYLCELSRDSVSDTYLIDWIGDIYGSIERHYPENIYWDLDALLTYVVKESVLSSSPELSFDQYHSLLESVFSIFGCEGDISFRYIHDFIYGFDWARWVKRDAEKRVGIHPYSKQFIQRMQNRGLELLDLIRLDDDKYCKLRSKYRNPFQFSREPNDEITLTKKLVDSGNLPIKSWEPYSIPLWEVDFEYVRMNYSIEAVRVSE